VHEGSPTTHRNVAAVDVDDLAAVGRRNVGHEEDDLAVLDRNVALDLVARRHDDAVLDHQVEVERERHVDERVEAQAGEREGGGERGEGRRGGTTTTTTRRRRRRRRTG